LLVAVAVVQTLVLNLVVAVALVVLELHQAFQLLHKELMPL
jgi:hypothetical protein